MRVLSALVLAIGFAVSATAQFGAQTHPLGGSFASPGMSRPLGGIAPPGGFNRGFRGSRESRRGTVGVLPYGYSYYVPNYFDDLDSYPPAYAPAYPPAPVPAPVAPPAPPVIINQYFAGPPPADQTAANAPAQPDSAGARNTQPSGAPLAPSTNYYLIAYKNHSIYPALAYWIEGDTLHYVTTENTHNQASLALIDLPLTKKLNQDRSVPFSIPGQ